MFRSHNSSHKLCPSFLVAALIFSVFTLTGIVSAAWVDAPNEPPAYGASGCSPFPCLEEDFRPMNLSSTPQAKQGAIGAWEFRDSNDSAYYIDPSGEGIAGRFKGSFAITNGIMSVGRADALSGAHAKFVVNMPETIGKTGSFGDAIYAYSDSTTNPDTDGNGIPDGAAISVEQGNASGYALYSSGGINYFGGNVGIGTQTPTEKLDVVGNIKASGTICDGAGNCSFAPPAGPHTGCVLTSIDETGTLGWRNIVGGACQSDPSFLSKCLVEGGQSVDGSGNCIYTYTNPVATFGWSREIRNGDSQYICANMGGHPTWTYLSHTTNTHTISCGGDYGLVYWDGGQFINWGQFGICGDGWVTVDTTVTCKVPVVASPGIYTKYCSGNGCTVSCDTGDVRTGCSCWESSTDWNNEQLQRCTPNGANGCRVDSPSGGNEKRAYAYCLNL